MEKLFKDRPHPEISSSEALGRIYGVDPMYMEQTPELQILMWLCEKQDHEERITRNNTICAEWIIEAISIIQQGIANKLEKNGVVIYKCGTIIRIDLKENVDVK